MTAAVIKPRSENAPAAPAMEAVEICPLCGSGEAERLFTAIDRYCGFPGEFTMIACRECRLMRLSPRPALAQLGDYYPEDDYYSYQAPPQLRSRGGLGEVRERIRDTVLASFGYRIEEPALWQKALRPVIEMLFYGPGSYGYRDRFPRHIAGGRALDIGCGNAFFLSLLKRHGWEVAGVDLSPAAATTAKKNFDIDVFTGNVEDAGFAGESFDLIYMSHSIEHMPDPVATLKVAAKLLRPGGKIQIETPNSDAYNFAKMATRWMPLEAPRHLFLFSPDTLQKALRAAGLRVTKTRTVFEGYYAWFDTYQVEETAGRMIAGRPRLRPSSYPRAIIHNLFARIHCALNSGRGDFIYCWAVKDAVAGKDGERSAT
jgi:2-polyprenyl-3-methyl-5-hydroxy-6-metoxy-1,4-benzoquinol methylase